jgi:lactoylglutathione lyase
MNIEHLAIWVKDLEAMKRFYCQQFDFKAGERYHNSKRGFSSYFLSGEGGARLELMQQDDIQAGNFLRGKRLGLAHFAISLGSENAVDQLTKRLQSARVKIVGEPRWTGDGYYESVIEDPEGNWVELTV